jgi:hypothetical protein
MRFQTILLAYAAGLTGFTPCVARGESDIPQMVLAIDLGTTNSYGAVLAGKYISPVDDGVSGDRAWRSLFLCKCDELENPNLHLDWPLNGA